MFYYLEKGFFAKRLWESNRKTIVCSSLKIETLLKSP